MNLLKNLAGAALLLAIGCAGKTNLPEEPTGPFPTTIKAATENLDNDLFPRTPSEEHKFLSPGDVLAITIPGDDSINGAYTIGPDGTISVPLAGEIEAAGRLREAVTDSLREALASFYSDPLVSVSVSAYAPRVAYVLGAVNSPGSVDVLPTDNLLTVLAKAGGPRERFNERRQSLGLPQTARIVRDDDAVAYVNLQRILTGEDLAANVAIQPDDVIFVPLDSTASVSVLGEVASPGLIGLGPGMDIVQAVSLAGGFTIDADRTRVYVIRQWWNEEPLLYSLNYNAILKGGERVPPLLLEDQDIVFIETRGLAKFDYVFKKITPALTVVGPTGP